jgi:hypothetical protein
MFQLEPTDSEITRASCPSGRAAVSFKIRNANLFVRSFKSKEFISLSFLKYFQNSAIGNLHSALPKNRHSPNFPTIGNRQSKIGNAKESAMPTAPARFR